MLRETRFVRQLMNLVLCRNLLHQNVQMQVQKYVERHRHLKRNLQVQVTMGMTMRMTMGMEEMGQTGMERVYQMCRHLDNY
jgi:hypothetical protein